MIAPLHATRPMRSSLSGAAADWAVRDRAAWLGRFRRRLATQEPALRSLICEETGKPAWEALTSDIMPLLAACRWLERRLERLLRERRLRGGAFWQVGERHWVVREPLGTIAIIATWNYPVQLLGVQLVQALAAGNRVVVKPSEHAPRTQVRLMQLAAEAGLPEGMLRWVEATREAGRELLAGERFDHVVFTGSTGVGRAVAAWAAETLTPTTLELSGRDSAIVLADADTALAADAIWSGVTTNAGQTCMAPRRVLVEGAIYGRFLAALAPLVASARPVRLISAHAAALAFGLARDAVGAGGRSLSGVLEPPGSPDGRWLRPLAIVDCPVDSPLADGDHFGPVVAVVPVLSLDGAVAAHRRCGQHLATSVFSRRPLPGLAGQLGTANIVFNDVVRPVGHPAVGIGGVGESGWGVTRGEGGLLAMTRAVSVSRTSRLIRPPTAPPTAARAERIAAAVRWWYGGSAVAAGAAPVCSSPRPAADSTTQPVDPAAPARAAHIVEPTHHG